mmetsp:Transcript_53854/g.148476  ORF Transcript_53854/g.148476 Transcript_53854/m.148476 type:complete len:212 (+) Transcript_53854:381-1016(+)
MPRSAVPARSRSASAAGASANSASSPADSLVGVSSEGDGSSGVPGQRHMKGAAADGASRRSHSRKARMGARLERRLRSSIFCSSSLRRGPCAHASSCRKPGRRPTPATASPRLASQTAAVAFSAATKAAKPSSGGFDDAWAKKQRSASDSETTPRKRSRDSARHAWRVSSGATSSTLIVACTSKRKARAACVGGRSEVQASITSGVASLSV